ARCSVARGNWHIRNFGPQKHSLLQLKTIPLLMGPFQSDRGIGSEMVKITGMEPAPRPRRMWGAEFGSLRLLASRTDRPCCDDEFSGEARCSSAQADTAKPLDER